MIRRIGLGVAIALMATACANVQVTDRPSASDQVGQVPNLYVESSAPVGGTLFKQFKYLSKTGYRLTQPIQIGFKLGSIVAAKGDFLSKAQKDGRTVYCTEKRAYVDPIVGPIATACFIDSNGDGAFDKVTAAPGAYWFENDLSLPLGFERSEQILPRAC